MRASYQEVSRWQREGGVEFSIDQWHHSKWTCLQHAEQAEKTFPQWYSSLACLVSQVEADECSSSHFLGASLSSPSFPGSYSSSFPNPALTAPWKHVQACVPVCVERLWSFSRTAVVSHFGPIEMMILWVQKRNTMSHVLSSQLSTQMSPGVYDGHRPAWRLKMREVRESQRAAQTQEMSSLYPVLETSVLEDLDSQDSLESEWNHISAGVNLSVKRAMGEMKVGWGANCTYRNSYHKGLSVQK